MKSEPKEVQAARIQSQSAILVAIISAIITCAVSFTTVFFAFPPFQDWVRSKIANEEPQALPIAELPQQIFGYADTTSGSWGAFWLVLDENKSTSYRLDYWLPADKSGFAGLAFQFMKGENLSAYNAVECVIVFSQSPDEIDLYFKDIADNFDTIRVMSGSANEMTVRYEFSNYPNINFNAIKEFGIIINTDFATGGHQIRIKSIRFVK